MNQQLKRAIELHNSGHIVEATWIYQLILEEMPRHPTANHNLGIIKSLSGDSQTAIMLLKISVEEQPSNEQFWMSYIETLITNNQKKNAIKYLQKAKKKGLSEPNLSKLSAKISMLNTDNAQTKTNKSESPSNLHLKKILDIYNSGDLRTAQKLALTTTEKYPQHPFCWQLLSLVYQREGQLKQALIAVETAVSLDRDDHPMYFIYGLVLQNLGRFELAIERYQTCIALAPKEINAYNNLGSCLQRLGKFPEAKAILLKSISLENNNYHAFNNLGVVLLNLGDNIQAEKNFKQAIKLGPEHPEAHNNLGSSLNASNKLDRAERCFLKAIELRPNYVNALYNLGVILEKKKKTEEALIQYERVHSLDANYEYLLGTIVHLKMRLAIWDDLSDQIDTITNEIINGKKSCSPFVVHSLIGIPEIQIKSSQIYWDSIFQAEKIPLAKDPQDNHAKLRIGYFSPDFKNHPVAHLTAELYSQHDRDRFEVYAFSLNTGESDAFTNRIKSSVDYFHDVSELSDEEIVTLSRSLEIDIAVDLAGFTQGCRPKIFSLSVAPIQVGYIGFLGTMGTKCFDFIISDKTLIPEEYKKFYSEKIVYLPSYQVNDSRLIPIEQIGDKIYFKIPHKAFVFCCFNSVYKITPSIFNSWARILKKVDSSVLLLYSDDDKAKLNLRIEIAKRGIDPKRLIFSGFLERSQYLARYQHVDLFLDTLPYNSGATASDALRMGVPVVTCMGESFASRVCASLLTAVGIPELISTSPVQYERIAIELSTNAGKLQDLKDKLKATRFSSRLFDSKLFTTNLENAFLKMQGQHERQELFKDIYIEDGDFN